MIALAVADRLHDQYSLGNPLRLANEHGMQLGTQQTQHQNIHCTKNMHNNEDEEGGSDKAMWQDKTIRTYVPRYAGQYIVQSPTTSITQMC
jgi:hypothetical protein